LRHALLNAWRKGDSSTTNRCTTSASSTSYAAPIFLFTKA
jgi:hypothetical protein